MGDGGTCVAAYELGGSAGAVRENIEKMIVCTSRPNVAIRLSNSLQVEYFHVKPFYREYTLKNGRKEKPL